MAFKVTPGRNLFCSHDPVNIYKGVCHVCVYLHIFKEKMFQKHAVYSNTL